MAEDVVVDLGVLTTWEIAERTSATKLRSSFPPEYLKILPDQKRRNKSILMDAIREEMPDVVIRPQETDPDSGLRGFSLFRETKSKPNAPNVLDPVATVAVDSNGTVYVPTGEADRASLQEKFDQYTDLLSASMVASVLVDAISLLGGTGGVRPAGGVYFVLQDAVDEFKRVTSAAQAAAMQGKTNVYFFTVRKDAETVSALHSAVERDIIQFLKDAEAAILSETIGTKGIETQLNNIRFQMGRFNKFEGALGTFAEKVKAHLVELESSALITQMRLAGGSCE